MIRKAICAALLVAVAAWPHAPKAQDDPFTVRSVEVDVTAASGADAREKAITEAQRLAFQRLVARMVPAGSRQAVPKVEGRALDDVVRDFEVDSEKMSAVRYLGTFTVRFKPDAVRDLLRGSQVAYTETASKPLLVLPLYRAEGALILWDDPNPWREAWANLGPSDGFVPIAVPNGDIADVQDIGPDQALRRDADRLRSIAARYGAAGVLLAYATLRMDAASSRPILDVTATRSGAALPEQTLVFTFGDEPTTEALLARAVETVRSGVEDAWKRDNVLRFDKAQSLTVTVPLSSLADWIEIKKRLANVAFVRRSEIKTLSREAAIVSLSFFGDEEQLGQALAQRDLALAPDGSSWTLSKR